ncbi:MAG TPA: SDR family NAD(P)-dependent oxidoreductase [Acidimicrobiia bacterium]|nr:SDR family NAD(P)-dependent oxidoreductase [Acidimicrobiia bacterium]
MRVFLTGATGAIGPATVRRLLENGHQVRAVARTDDKAAQLRAQGADPVAVDLFDGEALKSAVDGCEAVLHLATNVPPLRRMSSKKGWATHNSLRTTATELLVDAAVTTGVTTFVKESVTFVYPDSGDAWIDETTRPDESIEMLRPTLEGERIVGRFTAGGGRGIVLRFGLFYGPTARGTDEALRLARWRMSMVGGKPEAYLSSVHTDDAAAAAVAALDAPAGIYNAVENEPVTRRDYLDAFSAAFGVGRLRPMPTWLVKLVSGSAAAAVIRSWRVSNKKLRDATGWSPRYPSVREGWPAVAREREASRV